MKTILKISHLARAIAHAKAIDLAKWSVWVKTCEKPFNRNIRVVLCKKPLQKAANN